MSDSAPLGNLPIYTARTWTTGESMTRTKFQSEFDQAEALLTLCKTALADIQNRRHGGSAPTENAIAGQIWAKKISAARTQWYGDPDAAGADDQFLTEGEAYNADNKTAGTGTVKAGGPIVVDTANYSANPGGTLAPYTIPLGTIDSTSRFVVVECGGTRTGSVGDITVRMRFNALTGDATDFDFVLPTTATTWTVTASIYRTTDTTAKMVFTVSTNSDATVATDRAQIASGKTVNWSADSVVVSFSHLTGTAPDALQQTDFLMEFS